MRLRKDPNAMEKLKDTSFLVTSIPIRVDKDTIIEIGMGKGEMITELAKENKDKKYIGIEKYPTVALKAARRAESNDLKNFRIVVEDVKNLKDIIKGQVETIWLTFSDPWPKARHYKRRLTYKYFLELYKDILVPEGKIRFKTDNDILFEWSIDSLKENGWKLKNITRDFHNHKSSKDNVMTGYELKWSSQGKNINYLEAYKKVKKELIT